MSMRNNKRHCVEKLETGRKTKSKYLADNDSIKSSSGGSKTGSVKSVKHQKKKSNCVDNFFIVDKIIGHKLKDDKNYYKVRWQGYDQDEDSWEPEENLTNVLDLIEEYFKSSETGSCTSSSGRRSKNVGSYVYVPTAELVASKTKYFDDIRDGKIDLTKNDLYSRVKTRKRLDEKFVNKSMDNANEIDINLDLKGIPRDKSMENSNSTSSLSEQSEIKFYSASNVDEMTNDLFDACPNNMNDEEYNLNHIFLEKHADELETLMDEEPMKKVDQDYVGLDFPEVSDDGDKNHQLNQDELLIFNCSNSSQTTLINSVTVTEDIDECDEENDTIDREMDDDDDDDDDDDVDDDCASLGVPPIQTISELCTIKSDVGVNTEMGVQESRGVQTDSVRIYEDITIKSKSGNHNNNGTLSELLGHLDANQLHTQNLKRKNVVTSDTEIFNAYSRMVHQKRNPTDSLKSEELPDEYWLGDLPSYEPESIMGHIETLDELRTAIELNRYNVVRKSVWNPDRHIEFDWSRGYVQDGFSPVQLCVLRDRVEMLQLLLQCPHGARGDEAGHLDPYTSSPVVMAARLGHTACLSVLLNAAVCRHLQSTPDTTVAGANTTVPISAAASVMRLLDCALLAAIRAKRTNSVLLLLKWGAGLRDKKSVQFTQTLYSLNTELAHTVLRHQSCFMEAINRQLKKHLIRMNLRGLHLLFPVRWISVLEPDINIEFSLNDPPHSSQHTPLLFLIHGYRDEVESPVSLSSVYHLWCSNGPCAVTSVTLNTRHLQISISDKLFVTSLWPISYSAPNTLYIRLDSSLSCHTLLPNTRVAVVALYVTPFSSHIA